MNMWYMNPDSAPERYKKTAGSARAAVFMRRGLLLVIAGLLVLCCTCSLVVYLEWIKPLLAR